MARKTPVPTERDLEPRIAIAAIVGVTLAAFGYLFTCDFTSWDDQSFIIRNVWISHPSVESLLHYWHAPLQDIYIPLTTTLWVVLAAIGRTPTPDPSGNYLNPLVFHAVNVLVHATAAVLAFSVLRRLIRSNLAALAGALVFALHPVQVETVGWVSGLKDLLSGCLMLGTIAAYLATVERPTRGRYAVVLALAAAAMLAKPSAMLLGAIVFAIDWLLLARPMKTVIRWTAPLLLLGAATAAVARWLQPTSSLAHDVPVWKRPLIVGDALAFYLRQIVWPAQLAPDYGHNPATAMASPWFAVTWLVPVVAIAAAAVLWRKSRWPAAGLAVFVLAPLHTLGWIPFDFQVYSTVADHYQYVAMFGIGMITAWLVTRLPRSAAISAITVIALAMGVRSAVQCTVWRDTPTLFTHTLSVNGNSWAAYTSLAAYNVDTATSADSPQLDEAMRQADQSIAIRPIDALPYMIRGSIYVRRGDLARATAEYRTAVELAPQDSRTLSHLGGILAQQSRLPEAAPLLERAVQVDPTDPEARLNFGHILADLGHREQAIEQLRIAQRLKPDDPAPAQLLQSLGATP